MSPVAKRLRAAASKAGLLLKLLPRHPLEAYDRIAHFASGRTRPRSGVDEGYEPQDWQQVLAALSQALGADLESLRRESDLAAFRQEISRRIAGLGRLPFDPSHTGDVHLGMLCYLVCRCLRPAVVVETGVAYGLTSAFILQALELNQRGSLHSIDLPPLARDADRSVGALVPDRLKQRWSLLRGTSRRLLPGLLEGLGSIDVFLHDSLHTEKNMKAEFELAHRYLRRPGVLISDDVDHNSAWRDYAARHRPAFTAVARESEKENLIGVSVLR